MGREEGPGILTWPFGTGSLFGSLSSPDTAVAATNSRARLATDFFPAPVCLDSLAPQGTEAYFWDLPSSGMPEIGGKVAGSRGVAEIPRPQEGKVLPRAGLETPPRDFFSWTLFLLGLGRGSLPVAAAAVAAAAATPGKLGRLPPFPQSTLCIFLGGEIVSCSASPCLPCLSTTEINPRGAEDRQVPGTLGRVSLPWTFECLGVSRGSLGLFSLAWPPSLG